MSACFRNILIITLNGMRGMLRILVLVGFDWLVGTSFIHMDSLHTVGSMVHGSVISSDTRSPHSTVIMCQQRSEENSAFIITNLVSAYYGSDTHISLNQLEKGQTHLSLSFIAFIDTSLHRRSQLMKMLSPLQSSLKFKSSWPSMIKK